MSQQFERETDQFLLLPLVPTELESGLHPGPARLRQLPQGGVPVGSSPCFSCGTLRSSSWSNVRSHLLLLRRKFDSFRLLALVVLRNPILSLVADSCVLVLNVQGYVWDWFLERAGSLRGESQNEVGRGSSLLSSCLL